jgi:hypothetical protein
MRMRKSYTGELHLPVFKQGDDLAFCLRQTKTQGDALRRYAEQLRAAATMCEIVADCCDTHREIEIDADTHYIGVTGPWNVIHDMIRRDLLSESPDEEEDAEEFWTN